MLGDVVVLVIVGVVVYVLVRALQERGEWAGRRPKAPGRRPPARRTPTGPPPRMVAPDDDEEFLRDLDRRRRNPGSPE